MKERFLVIIVLCLFTQPVFSQKQGPAFIDSLKSEIPKALADTSRINIYNGLGNAYIYIDPIAAMKYANQSLHLSEKIGFKKGMASAYCIMSAINRSDGEGKKSAQNGRQALELALKSNDEQVMFDAYKAGFYVFIYEANYSEALKSIYAALKIAERMGNTVNIATAYHGLGYLYYQQKNFPDALTNFFLSLKMGKEIDNWAIVGSNAMCVAIIYAGQGKHSEALQFYEEALQENQKVGNKTFGAFLYDNIGEAHAKLGNYPEALKNYSAASKILNEVGDKVLIANVYSNMGAMYMKLKRFSEARKYLDSGLSVSKATGSVEYLKKSYENLSVLDSATGNWKSALENYEQFVFYRDRIINEEHTKKTVQASMQYDFDKKESAATIIQNKKDALAREETQFQKNIRNSVSAGLGIAALFSIVVYRQRNKILKEKKRSDELLLNILPSEVAEELKLSGSAEAKQFDEVTVMFTDFKDFTLITEKLSPSELVAEIHYCFTAFDNIITKYEIEKIKTIGDSYMCVGGLPVANTTNAKDMVSAAIEIKEFMQEYIQQRNLQGRDAFEIRIGVHTGPVVAGIVGVKKFAYDIWGDTVNIASRMEESGEVGEVNISQRTYELVKDSFTCTHRGKIVVQNKGEIEMYCAESIPHVAYQHL